MTQPVQPWREGNPEGRLHVETSPSAEYAVTVRSTPLGLVVERWELHGAFGARRWRVYEATTFSPQLIWRVWEIGAGAGWFANQ